ncbi:MAG: bifunctional oligoribonuclease/PAP phosphatase NrnA [Hornefia sp.]|nr:bifunctional oligoribonuclease/PAP phosphatase NrnA [Hornefia sp.]
MSNDSFKTIGNALKAANSILIFPHVNGDGDAIGSAVALCRALRKSGKTAYILVEDSIPQNLKFIALDYATCNFHVIAEPDVCICVDCGDYSRFPKRKDKFLSGKKTICVDHHGTSKPFCNYNYIDSAAAATGELIYKLLAEMDAPMDKEIGEALFTAITMDTGNFQYSNTTKETHEIVAKLYELGIDANRISIELYESISPEKMRLESKILSKVQFFGKGKLAIGFVSQDMLKETGAKLEDAEGVVSQIRSINGVEIAVLVKEKEELVCRVSLRGKKYADVSKIAESFHGGGHKKAAGCTVEMSLSDAIKAIEEKALESLSEYAN